jgi:hypothetical protein
MPPRLLQAGLWCTCGHWVAADTLTMEVHGLLLLQRHSGPGIERALF